MQNKGHPPSPYLERFCTFAIEIGLIPVSVTPFAYLVSGLERHSLCWVQMWIKDKSYTIDFQ